MLQEKWGHYLHSTILSNLHSIILSPNELTYFAIEIIYCLHQNNEDLLKDKSISNTLKEIWSVLEKHDRLFPSRMHNFQRLKQHIKLARLLMEIHKSFKEEKNEKGTDILFELIKAPFDRYPEHFQFLADFLRLQVNEEETFIKFLEILASKSHFADLKRKIIENALIPLLLFSMKKLDFHVLKCVNKENNKKFHQAVLACFKELTNDECKIKKPLLQFSCLLLVCAYYYK